MNTMTTTEQITGTTLAELISHGGPSGGPLDDLRTRAIRRAGELGLPTREDEEWRYTNTAPIQNLAYTLPEKARFDGITELDALDIETCARIVFVDGRFAPAMSDLSGVPNGISVGVFDRSTDDAPISELTEEVARSLELARDGFEALAGGLLSNGVTVIADENIRCDQAILIVHRSTAGETPVLTAPRLVVRAANGSRVRIVEDIQGDEGAQGLMLTRADLDASTGSHITHSTLLREPKTRFYVATLGVRQDGDSLVHSDRVLLGSGIARNNIHALIEGEKAETAFNGLYLPEDRQLHDSHIRVEHLAEDCHSRQHYRGLLLDRSRAVFTGRIFVKDVAQKTDAIQNVSNLLLSPDAQVTTKPQLEIYADAVRCTHGATSGELDENSLFYLKARGIPERTARLLLLHAFAGENVDRIEDEDMRTAVRELINHRLDAALNRTA